MFALTLIVIGRNSELVKETIVEVLIAVWRLKQQRNVSFACRTFPCKLKNTIPSGE